MTDAREKLIRARAKLIVEQPFFGTLALHLAPIEDSTCETCATDGKSLLYSAEFVESLPDSELRAVVAHEVMHCALLHHTRRAARDREDWNRACDYAVNRDLTKAGFRLPSCALLDSRFDGMGAEEIYSVLRRERREREQQGGGDPQGSGPGKADPGGMGEIRDAAPDHEPAATADAVAEWQARAAQAVAVAKARNAGSIPSALDRVAESLVKPRIDWRSELRRYIDQSSVRDFSWSRPNRRFVAKGLILPGYVSDSLSHLAIAVDTSGSIDPGVLAAFESEIKAALDEGAADRVSVVYCDATINRVVEFDRGDDFKLSAKGGGGTDFAPVMSWADDVGSISALVYLTDLRCRSYGIEPGCPVIWAGYNLAGTGDRWSNVPFGDVITLD